MQILSDQQVILYMSRAYTLCKMYHEALKIKHICFIYFVYKYEINCQLGLMNEGYGGMVYLYIPNDVSRS